MVSLLLEVAHEGGTVGESSFAAAAEQGALFVLLVDVLDQVVAVAVALFAKVAGVRGNARVAGVVPAVGVWLSHDENLSAPGDQTLAHQPSISFDTHVVQAFDRRGGKEAVHVVCWYEVSRYRHDAAADGVASGPAARGLTWVTSGPWGAAIVSAA